MTKKKRILCLLLALTMLLSLAACGSGKQEEEEVLESTGGKDVTRAPALDAASAYFFDHGHLFCPVLCPVRVRRRRSLEHGGC